MMARHRANPERLMKLSSIMLITAALAFGVEGAASAQQAASQSTPPPAPQAKKGHDPNEVVCEKVEVPGSRLVSKKVCMTRGEWADQQRQDRLATDKAQMVRPCNAQSAGC